MRAEDALIISRMPDSALLHLIRYFDLVGSGEPGEGWGVGVVRALAARGLGQADVVLALLRGPEDLHACAEALVGRAIEILPGVDLGRPPPPAAPEVPAADRRRVAAVAPNPRLPTTGSFHRFKHFRVGRTVAQLLTRGVTRRDIREAQRNGWVRLEATVEEGAESC